MNAMQPRPSRVMLAIGSNAPPIGSMQIALHLAAALEAELASVFVEDVDLLRVAALPFSQEVGLVSASARPLDPAHVEAMLRRRAEQARRALAELAADSRLKWSFRVARGTMLLEVMGAASRADVVVAAGSRAPGTGQTGTLAWEARGAVSVVFALGEAGERALSAALSLAGGEPSRLTVLVPADDVGDPHALRERLARLMRASGDLPKLVNLQSHGPGELIREARRRSSRVLVLSPVSLRDGEAGVRWLLERGDCPIVLVP